MRIDRRHRPRLDPLEEARKTRETLAKAAVYTTKLIAVAELWKHTVAVEHDDGVTDE